MCKVILITGHLAALKSTISNRLSNDLNIINLNKDSIKEVLGDSIGFHSREENLKLSQATFKILKFMMKKSMDNHQVILLESNFKKHELHELLLEISHPEKNTYTLFLTGDPHVLYDRYVERQPLRHHVHTSTGLLSFQVFEKVMDEYRVEDCFGFTKKVDTTHFTESMYQEILKEIKAFIHMKT
jgi:shikimate kinase